MNKLLELEIIKPIETKKFRVAWVSIEAPNGNFIVGPNHIPLISLLSEKGKITYQLENGKKESFNAFGGILKVENNKAIILLN